MLTSEQLDEAFMIEQSALREALTEWFVAHAFELQDLPIDNHMMRRSRAQNHVDNLMVALNAKRLCYDTSY